jgi:hypothetical protein
MYVELREKDKKYYVLFRDDEDSKSKSVAQFVSASEVESYNIAKQYAKQNKCLIRVTEGGEETPELPTQPIGEG